MTDGDGFTLLSDDDIYLFNEGTHARLYEKLGSHIVDGPGGGGVVFAVWAPDAEAVSVVGDFNGWWPGANPLRPRASSGIWEGFVSGIGKGAIYKYHVRSRFHGYEVEKADPYAIHAETPPRTGSIVWKIDYDWGDGDWMAARREHAGLRRPVSIYELHLGSWMRGDDGRMLTYREVAERLPTYVKELGFTHVEFLPVMEHPFSGRGATR